MSIITTSAHCAAFAVSENLEPRFRGLLYRSAPGPQAHDNLHAGIPKVVGMGEALAAVADHGHLFRAYPIGLDVLFVEDVHCSPSSRVCRDGTSLPEKVNTRSLEDIDGRSSVLQDRDLHPAVLCPAFLRGVVAHGHPGAHAAGGYLLCPSRSRVTGSASATARARCSESVW